MEKIFFGFQKWEFKNNVFLKKKVEKLKS